MQASVETKFIMTTISMIYKVHIRSHYLITFVSDILMIKYVRDAY